MDAAIIVVIALAVVALLAFLISRNRRDRKELFPPGSGDAVSDEKKEQLENKEEL
ncbi:hypothetical protein AAHN97_18325 [Chitinophaga niabensis]|uniref:hypothetical protein n=1 Tax=Chitinophaga niabensis TaxID=536979 RepID=UPI0031B9E500